MGRKGRKGEREKERKRERREKIREKIRGIGGSIYLVIYYSCFRYNLITYLI
jgi:hypothetical protein